MGRCVGGVGWTEWYSHSGVLFALIIIIRRMYIYHTLMNTLSAHMMHVNLNMILYYYIHT